MSFNNEYSSKLPSFNEFKTRNVICLSPPIPEKLNDEYSLENESDSSKKSTSKKELLIINTSNFSEIVSRKLEKIYMSYINRFEEICDKIVNSKYKNIYNSIFKFCQESLKKRNEEFLHSLVINTDQNSESFFMGLSKYLISKNIEKEISSQILAKGEQHFKDLKILFKDLGIDDLTLEIDKGNILTKIIVIGELSRIENVNLNIFLDRLIDYQKQNNPQFNYVLIFDVSYDLKSLFNKIKTNLLSKMQFTNIEMVSSNNLYQEILFKFNIEDNNLLIANSNHIKIIVDYINEHQISIMSFKHYFKFVIFSFFFMHEWYDDEYLIFSPKLNQIENKENKTIEMFFKKELEEIYFVSNNNNIKKNKSFINDEDVSKLTNLFMDKFYTNTLFFVFYKSFQLFFENINNNLNKITYFDKYSFYFEFLQSNQEKEYEKIKYKRKQLLLKYLDLFEEQNFEEPFKKIFIPKFKHLTKDYVSSMTEKDKIIFNNLLKDLDNIFKIKSENNNITSAKDNFEFWVNSLFELECFKKINIYDNDTNKEKNAKANRKYINVYKYYLQFDEIINPSMLNVIMNNLLETFCFEKKDIKANFNINKNVFSIKNIMKSYIKNFRLLGTTFSLKSFFINFLKDFGISNINSIEKTKYEQFKDLFIYLSYWFCINGFFTRKGGRTNQKELYVKNYFKPSSYN